MKAKSARVEQAFDAIADEWNQCRTRPMTVLKLFLPFLKKRVDTALDAGCGNGRNFLEISKHARLVYGVDVSEKMLEHARKRIAEQGLNEKVRLFKASFLEMPLDDESVDAAFYLASLHHIPKDEQEKAFREMNRVLKPGGTVFASVWNKDQKRFWEARENEFFVRWKKAGGEVVERFHYFFGEKELRNLAENNGFKILNCFHETAGRKVDRKGAFNLCIVLSKLK